MRALLCLAIVLPAAVHAQTAAPDKPTSVDIPLLKKLKPDRVVRGRWQTSYYFCIHQPVAQVTGPLKKQLAAAGWTKKYEQKDYVAFGKKFPGASVPRASVYLRPMKVNGNGGGVKGTEHTWSTIWVNQYSKSAMLIPKSG